MATGQPQSYGSIREFLDNLPNQPCIWQPENANICVTCLRINEPVARICSVWAQALEEAPLEEIDFEEGNEDGHEKSGKGKCTEASQEKNGQKRD